MTHEADQLDQASELTIKTTESAIEAVRRLNKPEQTRNPDGSWPHTECVDCENEIAAGRLALGKIRCIYCQTALERGRQR